MNLVSEGVYLDENCATNPSRHVPGPTPAMTNWKMLILGSRGFQAEILYINSRSTALSGLYVNMYISKHVPPTALVLEDPIATLRELIQLNIFGPIASLCRLCDSWEGVDYKSNNNQISSRQAAKSLSRTKFVSCCNATTLLTTPGGTCSVQSKPTRLCTYFWYLLIDIALQ